jgi:hypothetical protein
MDIFMRFVKLALLDIREQHRLEQLIDRWILDPSSFIGPDGDVSTLYMQHPHGY